MIEPWPAGLPQRVKYGGQATLNSKGNRQVTEFDYGPKRMRRLFVNQPSREKCTITFKDNEIEIFNSYVMDTLKDGTRYFWFRVPVGNSMIEHRVRLLNDEFNVIHTTWNESTFELDLEVFERFRYTPAELWLLGEYGADFVESPLCDALQRVVNVTWPKITENYR